MIKYYLLLIVVCLMIAITQTILKTLAIEYEGNIFKSLGDPMTFFSFFLLILALALWFVSASQIESYILMPASLLTIILSTIISVIYFKEAINARTIVAYILILIGLVILIYSKPFKASDKVDISKSEIKTTLNK
jgi:drug/metabolite transporter (DMT)-like permease